jgi:hypothetical protein
MALLSSVLSSPSVLPPWDSANTVSRKYGTDSAKRRPSINTRFGQPWMKVARIGPRACPDFRESSVPGVEGAGDRAPWAGATTASRKTGLSRRLCRIQNVTTRITAASRNGTRQPQAYSRASSSVYTQANTNVISSCAEKPPVFGHALKKPRRRAGSSGPSRERDQQDRARTLCSVDG